MSNVNDSEIIRDYDLLDILILDSIYNKGTCIQSLIVKSLTFAHRVTISKRIKRLNDWNLIRIIADTKPICITKNVDKEDIIIKIIEAHKKKWRLK